MLIHPPGYFCCGSKRYFPQSLLIKSPWQIILMSHSQATCKVTIDQISSRLVFWISRLCLCSGELATMLDLNGPTYVVSSTRFVFNFLLWLLSYLGWLFFWGLWVLTVCYFLVLHNIQMYINLLTWHLCPIGMNYLFHTTTL